MTRTVTNECKPRGAGKAKVRLVLTSLLMLGAFVASAGAQEHRQDNRREEHRHFEPRRDRRDWNGGYYRTPPVVYGTPYYAPPPVVYGPGIVLPRVIIGID